MVMLGGVVTGTKRQPGTSGIGSNAAYQYAFGDQGYYDTALAGGSSTTIPNGTSTYILTGNVAITLTLPAAPFDGQFLTICQGDLNTSTLTALNPNAGQALAFTVPASITEATALRLMFVGSGGLGIIAANTWIRV
jgi:hypothetical protein